MKIGILTFQIAANYGAQLQSYSLRRFLTGQGHEVCVLNYIPDYFAIQYLPELRGKRFTGIRGTIQKLRYALFLQMPYKRKFEKFQSFGKKQLCLTEPFKARQEQPIDFDAIIYGSDQIWNPRITKGYDETFFCGAGSERTRRIAYAASCGNVETIASYEPEQFKKLLGQLDAVSCREIQLSEYIGTNCGKAAATVADPTLLLQKEELLAIAQKPRNCPEKYILVYQLAANEQMKRAAKLLSKQTKLPVLTIFGDITAANYGKKGFHTVAVEEFVWLLVHAQTVLTNSFHGTSLSLLFHKDFYAFEGQNPNERIRSLLCLAGLEERIYNGCFCKPINYARVEDGLRPFIEASRTFLLTALQ